MDKANSSASNQKTENLTSQQPIMNEEIHEARRQICQDILNMRKRRDHMEFQDSIDSNFTGAFLRVTLLFLYMKTRDLW